MFNGKFGNEYNQKSQQNKIFKLLVKIGCFVVVVGGDVGHKPHDFLHVSWTYVLFPHICSHVGQPVSFWSSSHVS